MITRSCRSFVAGSSAALAALVYPLLAAAAPAVARDDDIRDIRPLISIPPWWYWLATGSAAALILALCFLAARYWRRRSQRALTPRQRALERLAEAEALASAGQCREWADVVAHTLRDALAARLERAALPETTGELQGLDWQKLPHGQTVDAPRLVELLSTCDLTRFALGRLDARALLAETERARDFVERLFAEPETPTPVAAQAPLGAQTPAIEAKQ
jgi:hypothetical protein